MSIIIELFVVAYLAAVVLVSMLFIVWLMSLLFDFDRSRRKAPQQQAHRHM